MISFSQGGAAKIKSQVVFRVWLPNHCHRLVAQVSIGALLCTYNALDLPRF